MSYRVTTSALYHNSPKLKLNAELLPVIQDPAQLVEVKTRNPSLNPQQT